MSEVKWGSPPPSRRGQHDWAAIAKALRGRPGEWALVAEDDHHTYADSIRNGRLAAFRPAGSFEAVCRSVGRGAERRADIYARYVGEAEA